MKNNTNPGCGSAPCESLAKEPLVGSAKPAAETLFFIEKMDCPSEERQIRHRLGVMAGIEQLRFDLAQHRLTVTHRLTDLAPIERALAELGLPPTRQELRTSEFHVPRMDCKSEVAQIRDRLALISGIEDLRFDLVRRVVSVDHRLDSTSTVTDALADLGMPAMDQPEVLGRQHEGSAPLLGPVDEQHHCHRARSSPLPRQFAQQRRCQGGLSHGTTVNAAATSSANSNEIHRVAAHWLGSGQVRGGVFENIPPTRCFKLETNEAGTLRIPADPAIDEKAESP